MTEPITALAAWLAGHVEWMRHRQEADEFLDAVDACLRVVRGLARGPAEQKYLGPCGVVLAATAEPCPDGCSCAAGPRTAVLDACAGCFCLTACHPIVDTDAEGQICDGDVYSHGGSTRGRCRVCGAEVSTAERAAWLDGEVRSHAFRDIEIARAYGVNVKTMRTWHDRGVLIAHGEDREGRPLFNVGETLDMFRALAVRQAEDEAKRARRRERAAEEDAA